MVAERSYTELFRIGSRGGGAFPQSGDLFESVIEDIYCAVLKPGDLALDGGAHVGRHSFPMAECVGWNGLVLALEAHPKLARALARRARRHAGPVEVIGQALSDHIGRVPFHCVSRHTAYSGIAARRYDFDDDIRIIEVDATTIDALVSARRPRRLAFLKLDLEGGELRALEGAASVLAHDGPLIVFENDQENSARDYHYSKEDWFGFFTAMKYDTFNLWGEPYGPADWGRRDIPWYFIATPADSGYTKFVATELPQLLERYR